MRIPRSILRTAISLTLIAAFAAASTPSAAQLPDVPKKTRSEEEETDVPKKPGANTARPAPAKPTPAKAGRPPEAPAESELPAALAEDARKRGLATEIKNLYNRLATPFDTIATRDGKEYLAVPLPLREPEGEKLQYTEMLRNLPGKEYTLSVSSIAAVKSFEEYGMEQVDAFLARKTALDRVTVVENAISALAGVEAWHRYAIANHLRTGEGWAPVRERLQAKLLATRRELLSAFKVNRQWSNADQLARDLAGSFPADPGVLYDVAKYRLERARDTLKRDSEQDYRDFRKAAADFLLQPGAESDPVAEQAKNILRERARTLSRRARELGAQNNTSGALQLLRDAEAFDPDSADIKDARSTLKPTTLYIGVPALPERMSPTSATTDSERWAMELLFEPLLQAVPDDALGRVYRPQLAAAMPTGSGESRLFRLTKTARWSGAAKGPAGAVNSADVAGTLQHYRNFANAAGFEDIGLLGKDEIEDNSTIRLRLQQRVMEPLARFDFKVLPARLVPDLASDQFARHPVGSGPFRFQGYENETAERRCAVFAANPDYGTRPERFGSPAIREIRLYVPRVETAARDIAAGQLHLWVDPEAEAFTRTVNEPAITNLVSGSAMDANRRIWMLGINHRNPIFWKDELRRAISLAIDRETILKESLRPAGKTFHQPLAGPFPQNTWACPPNARPLYQPEISKSLFEAALKETDSMRLPLALTIRFCAADPGAAQACSQIKDHLEKRSEGKLRISVEGLSREVFQDKVFDRHEYELAYLPWDYRDDLFWLGGLLDGNAAGQKQRNFLGYLGQDSGAKTDDKRLDALLSQIRGNTDFARLKGQMAELHEAVTVRVPFVPLWQLDRLVIANSALEIRFEAAGAPKVPSSLDPATLFNGIDYWRLK